MLSFPLQKLFLSIAVLLEAPYNHRQNDSVLLTVDLTKGVVDEAIKRKDSMIIAYRNYSPATGTAAIFC
jgi:putative NIF3 family GTP cyclohydrolase 1 type 2